MGRDAQSAGVRAAAGRFLKTPSDLMSDSAGDAGNTSFHPFISFSFSYLVIVSCPFLSGIGSSMGQCIYVSHPSDPPPPQRRGSLEETSAV